jgi:hypothetical protein
VVSDNDGDAAIFGRRFELNDSGLIALVGVLNDVGAGLGHDRSEVVNTLLAQADRRCELGDRMASARDARKLCRQA